MFRNVEVNPWMITHVTAAPEVELQAPYVLPTAVTSSLYITQEMYVNVKRLLLLQ
jgi:hypothetical protein